MIYVSHVVQAIIVGAVLAFLTAQVIMNAVVKAMTTTVDSEGRALRGQHEYILHFPDR